MKLAKSALLKFENILGGLMSKLEEKNMDLKYLTIEDIFSRKYGLYPDNFVAASIQLPEKYSKDDLIRQRITVENWMELIAQTAKAIAYSNENLPKEAQLPPFVREYFHDVWLHIEEVLMPKL